MPWQAINHTFVAQLGWLAARCVENVHAWLCVLLEGKVVRSFIAEEMYNVEVFAGQLWFIRKL